MNASRRLIKRLLSTAGLEIRRKGSVPQRSFVDALRHARQLGLSPATVLDIGAAYGTFTLRCYDIFPESRYILVEPVKEYERYLEKVCRTLPNARHFAAAAGPKIGEIAINVHPDLVGSSVYLEREASDVNGTPRSVPQETIEHLCEEMKAAGPYLIKVDVQGAELAVLSGASRILNDAEYVILEVSLFEFFQDGPQLHDVVHYMKSRGFSVYDIFDLQYRPLDGALSQMDIAFVRDDGRFRSHHFYATAEQRKQQNEQMSKARME